MYKSFNFSTSSPTFLVIFSESAVGMKWYLTVILVCIFLITNNFKHISMCLLAIWGFPGGSAVKNLPAMQETQETQVRSRGWEDPLEESMATHSSTLAWRSPWTEEPGGLQSMGSQRVRYDWRDWEHIDTLAIYLSSLGECLFKSFAHLLFSIRFFLVFCSCYKHSLYSFYPRPLIDTWCSNIFSYSSCLVTFLIMFFDPNSF